MYYVSQEQIKEYQEKGVWPKETNLDRLRATAIEHPEKIAIVDPPDKEHLVGLKPERITYKELDRSIDAVATAFLKMGIKKDDIIMVQMPNTWELFLSYFAIWRVGAICTPFAAQWRSRESDYIAGLTDAKAYIVAEEFGGFDYVKLAEEIQRKNPTIEHVITLNQLRGMAKGEIAKEELDKVKQDANEICFIYWTSGTEADPKACPHSHNNLYCEGEMIRWNNALQEGATILAPFPQCNAAAAYANWIPWILTRGTYVLHHPFTPEIFINQLIEEKITWTAAAPSMILYILKHPKVNEFDLKRLKHIGCGSAPPSKFIVDGLFKRWNTKLTNLWGQSECTQMSVGPDEIPDMDLIANSWLPWYGRKGVEWKNPMGRTIETKIIDIETMEEQTKPGQVGELLYKGPNRIARYFRQPERTRASFTEDDFFHTGDNFEIGENNLIRYFDRRKDIIIRGGFNISAQEIEGIVSAHPKVIEAAVVAMPDPILGEKCCVYVVPKAGETVTLEDIKSFVKEQNVAVYKLPERLEVIDKLPRNPAQKILKVALREDVKKKLSEESMSE